MAAEVLTMRQAATYLRMCGPKDDPRTQGNAARRLRRMLERIERKGGRRYLTAVGGDRQGTRYRITRQALRACLPGFFGPPDERERAISQMVRSIRAELTEMSDRIDEVSEVANLAFDGVKALGR
jgi:hypothetical protein